MAFFVLLWLKVQVRKLAHIIGLVHHALCFRFLEQRRMNKWVAYSVLGILGLFTVLSASRCYGKHLDLLFIVEFSVVLTQLRRAICKNYRYLKPTNRVVP